MALAAKTPFEESELWRRYRQHGDLVARDRLAVMHLPWAAAVGKSVYRRVGIYGLDSEDFIQNARLGMLEAIGRFEPDRGVEFRAYARPRVRGAVFNGIRSMLQERGTAADERRHAERLDHFHDDERSPFDSVVDAVVGLGLGFLLEHAGAETGADAYAYARRDQTQARLKAAVARLPARLQSLVTAHYFEHVPFSEIADAEGVTKGRISQLHREALTRLRDALRDQR